MQLLKSKIVTEITDHWTKLVASGVYSYGYVIEFNEDSKELTISANRSEDIRFDADNEFYNFGKYYSCEWNSELSSPLTKSNQLIKDSFSDSFSEESLKEIVGDCIEALTEFRRENITDTDYDPFLMVWVEEPNDPFTLESIRKLNREDVIEELAKGLQLELDDVYGVVSPIAQLFDAIGDDDDQTALSLLESDPSLIAQTKISGRTPLHQAAFCGNLKIVTRLLELGADLNAQNSTGFTPLFYACAPKDESIGLLLMDHGCDVKIVDESKMTALHLAADMGKKEIAERIIQLGGDVNAVTTYQQTPMDAALEQGWEPMIKFLREHHAQKFSELKK